LYLIRDGLKSDLPCLRKLASVLDTVNLPDDAPLVISAGRALQRMSLDAKPRRKPTSTEAGVFARKGCEAIVFGPGRSTGNAHTPNERIEVAQLEKACDLYESLLLELCACT